MAAAVAELDASLQALRGLKPPGVTKSKIASITQLCVDNIKNESVLVQKIYTQFKRTPATHKLGVLYVVDSVTRQWIEKATASGETLGGGSNTDGTFAAGVQRMTDLLPLLVKDVISTAPEDQKDKVTKLVDIWDRGNIFPAPMIKDFKAKLETRQSARKTAPPSATRDGPDRVAAAAKTTTPPGNPPPNAIQPITQLSQTQQSAGPSASEILRGLAGATISQPQQQQQQHHHLQQQHPHLQQHSMQMPTSTSAPHPTGYPLPVFPPPPPQQQPFFSVPLPQAQQQQQQQTQTPPAADANVAITALRALESMLPPGAAQDPTQLQHWISVLQELQTRGVPPDQWAEVIRIMSEQQKPALAAAPAPLLPQAVTTTLPNRDRSRSPGRRRRSPDHNQHGSNNYRQRSPHRSASPVKSNGYQRSIEFDPTLPKGHIKVYSRTLFIGGTTCGEAELRRLFARFGEVQTCIAHPERRHAFIKMKTRAESQRARDGTDNARDPEITGRVRSTRWGVGFGPRDCSDYTTGISIIPIERLTEADRKWTLTAEFGGTGGRPIESGMVIEEPDIEIGAGVSSKAISQRPGQIGKDPAPSRKEERRSERRSRHNRSDVNAIPVGSPHHGSQHSSLEKQQQQQHQPAAAQQHFTMPQIPGYPSAPVHYDASAFSGMPAVPGYGFNFMNAPPGA